MPFSRQAVLAVLCAFGAFACGDVAAPATGAIRVAVSTTGVDLDPDGYTIRVGDGLSLPVASTGSVVVQGLSSGRQIVRMSGLSLNCGSSSSLSVDVLASDTVDAVFAVLCAADVGAINVVPATVGADRDVDGYTISIDGQPGQPIANSGFLFEGISAGQHTVALSGIADNCTVNPPIVTTNVQFRSTTTVQHVVSCVARTGSVQLQTTTTGPDPDSDGYLVMVDNSPAGSVTANGSVTLIQIQEGQRSIALSGVSANCTVIGPHPRLVTVAFAATTQMRFDVTCVEAAKVRVTLATTGIDPDQGYRVRVEGQGFDRTGEVAANGTLTITVMAAGAHTVTLDGVAVHCEIGVPSTATRTVTVTTGATVDVAFDVACTAAKQIAFVRYVGNNLDVVVSNSNGASFTLLTMNTADENDPEYSPSGDKIAFSSYRDGNSEIYVMNADGSAQIRLTNNPAGDLNPAWSPDGNKIAFRSNRDGNEEIYVMNADGSNVARLTNHASFDAKPSWSPDGSKIAFMSGRSGNSQIYVMNADGSNVTRLTNTTGWDGLPAWSPDGARIAFAREVSCDDYYSSCHNIAVMNADGTGVTMFASLSNDSEPTWSSDGRWIAFQTWYCDYYSCSSAGISAVKPDGKGRTEILFGDLYNPTWRP